MAHFAEIKQKQDPTGFTNNTLWVVERVIVVDNNISTSNGPLGENDGHVDGETWCQNFFKGGTWKQTSYNQNFRGVFAGKGSTYDFTKDKFIPQQPFASWSLDSNDDWQPPIAYPTIVTYDDNGENKPYKIYWDEENLTWEARDHSTPNNYFQWDASNLSWVAI